MFDRETDISRQGREIFQNFHHLPLFCDFILTDRSDWNVVFVNGGLVYVNTTQPYCSLTQPIWKVCTSQTSTCLLLWAMHIFGKSKSFASKESIQMCSFLLTVGLFLKKTFEFIYFGVLVIFNRKRIESIELTRIEKNPKKIQKSTKNSLSPFLMIHLAKWIICLSGQRQCQPALQRHWTTKTSGSTERERKQEHWKGRSTI